MSEPYIGEVRILAGRSAPQGWHPCDGSLMSIREYNALFSVLGATFGGDGKTTFALPDLRGRTPVGAIGSWRHPPLGLGEAGGAESVALQPAHMPAHTHEFRAVSKAGSQSSVVDGVFAMVQTPAETNLYAAMSKPDVTIDPSSLEVSGSGEAHDNMQPYLAVNYCIAIVGIYPPQA